MSDIRFISWAGYQFAQTGTGTTVNLSSCPPEFTSEDVGDLQVTGTDITNDAQLSGKDLKPKMVAFPNPTL